MFTGQLTFKNLLCTFIFIAFILTLSVSGQAQDLAWAKRAGGGATDLGIRIGVLSDGSALIVGYFGGTATFGLGEITSATLTSAGSEDIFIARYNFYGTLVWAKRAGGSGTDFGVGVATLSDDSALVTGEFSVTATFGPGEITSATLTSAGDRDIFVACYDSNGTLTWAKQAGGSGLDSGFGIALLSDGSAVVTGQFSDTATFGLGEITSATLTSAGSQDIFIARYNPDGTLVWAKRAGGSDVDYGVGVAVFSDNSALVTGEFSGTATFGLGEITSATLTSAGNRDIFVARYDSNGTLIWAKRAGGSGLDRGSDIAALFDGSARVTGEFSGTATFGPGESGETTLTSAGGEDIFIARYNSDGTLAWAKRAGGTGQDSGLEIAAFFDLTAAVTGFFSGSATFGPGESGETPLNSAGDRDIFVARYGSNGTLIWAKRAGGSGFDLGRGIAIAEPFFGWCVLVSGGFTATATFGSGESGETTLTSAGSTDIFVARFVGPVPGVNDWEEYGISEP